MEVRREEVRTTTTFLISVTELEAVQGKRDGNLAEMMHKALTTGNGHPPAIDPEQSELKINEAPAPANRLPQDAGGKPLVRCPYCKTDMVYYKLARHVKSASCKARAKRNATALRKKQKQIAAPKEN
jgi:uncharacterized C2H2 Zn-finger protein